MISSTGAYRDRKPSASPTWPAPRQWPSPRAIRSTNGPAADEFLQGLRLDGRRTEARDIGYPEVTSASREFRVLNAAGQPIKDGAQVTLTVTDPTGLLVEHLMTVHVGWKLVTSGVGRSGSRMDGEGFVPLVYPRINLFKGKRRERTVTVRVKVWLTGDAAPTDEILLDTRFVVQVIALPRLAMFFDQQEFDGNAVTLADDVPGLRSVEGLMAVLRVNARFIDGIEAAGGPCAIPSDRMHLLLELLEKPGTSNGWANGTKIEDVRGRSFRGVALNRRPGSMIVVGKEGSKLTCKARRSHDKNSGKRSRRNPLILKLEDFEVVQVRRLDKDELSPTKNGFITSIPADRIRSGASFSWDEWIRSVALN